MVIAPLLATFLAVAAGGSLPAFADRAALLSADARCGFLDPHERAALSASARQARGALSRAGWTQERLRYLDFEIVKAADARACDDPLLTGEAQRAKNAFLAWRNMHAISFPGSSPTDSDGWNARRTPDPGGWLMWQTLPSGGRFGVKLWDGEAPRLTLETAPGRVAAARLLARDTTVFSEPTPRPLRGAAQVWQAQARKTSAAALTFAFPDDAMLALGELDPADGALIELSAPDGSVSLRAKVAVGDFAAAAAFLAAGAERPKTASR